MACALCTTPIDESLDSREHVIPNALGGRKVVRGFLCKQCNSDTGTQWDSVLETQLRPLALLFGVKRQDGKETQSYGVEAAASGEKLWLNADGTMSPAAPPYREVSLPGGGRQIHITVRSMGEAKRKLRELCEKYPQLSFDELLKSARPRSVYLNEPLKMEWESFGGERAGRSIVKSAMCLAASMGFDAQRTEGIAYLRSEPVEPPFGFYHARDLVLHRPHQTPLHCVGVSTRNADGQILGYVEYFGFRRMVVRLAGHYAGPEMHMVYSIDPATGNELNLDVDLGLSRAQVDACFAYESVPEGAQEAIIDELMPLAIKRSFERERDRVVERAFRESMQALDIKENDDLPPEKFQEFSRLMAAALTAFLEPYIQRRRPEVRDDVE